MIAREAKVEIGTIQAVEKMIGRWLSRLLSYTYGGALALVVFRIVDPDRAEMLFRGLPWELGVLALVIIGAGIYRAHRSAVIPIHHWFGCFLFWLWDKANGTPAEKSMSPTRWFNSMKVGRCRRILAYNILRHDPEFLDPVEENRLDLRHAEFGLVVMSAEACFVGAVYAKLRYPSSPAWWGWAAVCLLFIAASYPAPLQQHASECLRWRIREDEEEREGVKTRPVSTALRKYGLLPQ